MLYNLIYFSHAANAMHTKDMNPILIQSRIKNTSHEITGMLVYVEGIFNDRTEGRFLQVLEGTELEVTAIYESIKGDSRHNQVTTIKDGPIENRKFSSWKMGYKSFNLQQYPDLKFFFQLDTRSLIYNDQEHPMLNLLQSLSDSGRNIR
jgi:hypothetical protein